MRTLICRADADNPWRNRIWIQRVITRTVIAGRKDNADPGIGHHLCRYVDGVIEIKNGVGGERTIDRLYIVLSAVLKQIIKTSQHPGQRQITSADAKNLRSRSYARVFTARSLTVARDDARDKRSMTIDQIGVRQILDINRI